jgi:hypothetical protein
MLDHSGTVFPIEDIFFHFSWRKRDFRTYRAVFFHFSLRKRDFRTYRAVYGPMSQSNFEPITVVFVVSLSRYTISELSA